jgi:hypothetical protein
MLNNAPRLLIDEALLAQAADKDPEVRIDCQIKGPQEIIFPEARIRLNTAG